MTDKQKNVLGKEPKISNNLINIGISLESQLVAIQEAVKEKKKKTIITRIISKYEKFIDKKIKLLKLKNYKVFKYNSDPRIITGEIEKLTNYKERKKIIDHGKKYIEKTR